jgi:hypothetical protein
MPEKWRTRYTSAGGREERQMQEARDGKAGKIEDKGKIYLVNVEIPF